MTTTHSQWTPRSSAIDTPAEIGARRIVTMGWNPDLPDFRDVDLDSHDQSPQTGDVKLADLLCAANLENGAKIDLRAQCSPIEDQGRLGSCTAQSVVGLMEYMMRRAGKDHIDGSRLFIYKVTRNLLGVTGDTGAYLRSTMHAVRAFGVPPEALWPYVVDRFEEEPTSFLYSYAQNFKAMKYVRLDKAGLTTKKILDNIKYVLCRGYPAAFGFTVYSSISGAADIPFPDARTDRRTGGHAVLAVGYDDNHRVGRTVVPSLIIRNSWGRAWGDQGYGYLPYEYILRGLARDFWTAYSWDWINTGAFDARP